MKFCFLPVNVEQVGFLQQATFGLIMTGKSLHDGYSWMCQ